MSSYREEMYRRGEPRRAEYAVSERSSESRNRTPAFLMREEQPGPGQMVLRSKKVEKGYYRRRSRSSSRSSSPDRRSFRIARSISPDRGSHTTRARSFSRVRVAGRGRLLSRSRSRSRSVSPEPEKIHVMERQRNPSADRIRTKIIEREARRVPSRSPSPEPAKIIKGPTVEREVITHWRDIDHGVTRARPRSPSPRSLSPVPIPLRTKETDIDIDVYHRDRRGHHHTDVDIDIHHSRSPTRHRSHSRGHSHVRAKSVDRRAISRFHEDTEVVIRSDRDRLRIEAEADRHKHRSRSAVPLRSPSPSYSEEADYITSRIDSRGKMGEAYKGHTKDWTIVDVPPGTERVRMDGVGGAAADVTWSRYGGVRRSKFYAERESEREREDELVVAEGTKGAHESKTSIQIYDKEHEIEIETSRCRARTNDMWTEMTKDLVTADAIERLGYEFEETKYFYYILAYLKYEDVVELVTLTDSIREARRKRARELEWEREYGDRHHHHSIDISHSHTHSHSHSRDRRRRSLSKH